MNQKTIIILSLAFVLVASVIVNEIVLETVSTAKERDVASYGERFEPNQIKWEQELAKTLSSEVQDQRIFAEKPTQNDQLLFEIFEGRYEIQYSNGYIQKISILSQQNPIEVKINQFMKLYSAIRKDFDIYEISQISAVSDSVQLKKKSGDVVGNLVINRDEKGRVLFIQIQ